MVRRVWVYGAFLTEREASPHVPFLAPGLRLSPPPTSEPALAPQALEILREFSVVEFIGKVYVLTPGRNYQPVTPLGVRNYTWWGQFQDAVKEGGKFYFKANDGDLWHVVWLRQESDDAASYIAAGLKHE